MCISVYLILVFMVIGLVAFAQAMTTWTWGTVLVGTIVGTILYFVIMFLGSLIRYLEKKNPKK